MPGRKQFFSFLRRRRRQAGDGAAAQKELAQDGAQLHLDVVNDDLDVINFRQMTSFRHNFTYSRRNFYDFQNSTSKNVPRRGEGNKPKREP